jgi:2-methylcitrate dehydratase PrpD
MTGYNEELALLADFIRSLNLNEVPSDVLSAARYCVLDSIGSALGAAILEEIPDIAEEFFQWMGAGCGKEASVWGQGKKLNVFPALLLNGIMGHALELDDVHALSKSHIGTVVVETAWTLADALGATGKEFLEAVLVGYEVMARVGMGMDVASNRKRGWHTTGIIGPFGAAAAAAKLLRLEKEQTVSALGMAGTQSSGLWAFLAEGSGCKKLHPARAAVNGLTAAVLAKAGMTGPAHILDADDGGLYRAVSDSFDMSALTKNLGQTYEITKIDKKPYPCCRTTHPAIDAALSLRGERDFAPEKTVKVLVETYDIGVLQCGTPAYPENALEAKFSIRYTLAAACVFGKVTMEEFSREALAHPLVKRIANRTDVKASELFTQRYPQRWGCRVTIELENGRKLSRQIDDMSGSVAVPLTEIQEQTKFMGLAQVVFQQETAEKIMKDILKIETLNRLPDLQGERVKKP